MFTAAYLTCFRFSDQPTLIICFCVSCLAFVENKFLLLKVLFKWTHFPLISTQEKSDQSGAGFQEQKALKEQLEVC